MRGELAVVDPAIDGVLGDAEVPGYVLNRDPGLCHGLAFCCTAIAHASYQSRRHPARIGLSLV
jgi:hypothetical protein